MDELSDSARRRRVRYLKALDLKCGVGAVLQVDGFTGDLRRRHEAGDPLAVFDCLVLWREERLPFATLPEWAIEAWSRIGVLYFRKLQRWHRSEARRRRKAEQQGTTRRRRRPPSFERVARLGGRQKQRSALARADRLALARQLRGAYEAILAEARGEPAHVVRLNARLERIVGGGALLKDGRFDGVLPLTSQGKPTQDLVEALAKRFRIRGHSRKARYREVRRLLRLAGFDKKDALINT